MELRIGRPAVAAVLCCLGAAATYACGGIDVAGSAAPAGAGGEGSGASGNGGSLFSSNGGSAASPGCTNLECQQVECSGGVTTTISGTIYDPAGKLPLYNVVVYVPNAPLEPVVDGASCDKCGVLSGDPLVTALTDTEGKFVLENVPVGKDIPVVFQLGKWRREIVVPSVGECADTALTDVGQTSLPSNQSEGHIPRIALTTGGADPLECLLRKIGMDPEEFTLSTGPGRINLFAGEGGSDQYDASMNGGVDFEPAQPFWSDLPTLMKYDVVLLACEGGQNPGQKPMPALQAVNDYTSAGGRMFASHWHNYWLEAGPNGWSTTANWNFQNDPPMPYTGLIDQTFPKGVAFAEWLVNVAASTVPGELPIVEPQHTVDTVNAPVQQWIYGAGPDTGSVKYFTFNTPLTVPEEDQCGRVVFSDIHVSSGDSIGDPFPTGCQTADLSPQEKALLFMLFDLSACIQPDDDPPVPPID